MMNLTNNENQRRTTLAWSRLNAIAESAKSPTTGPIRGRTRRGYNIDTKTLVALLLNPGDALDRTRGGGVKLSRDSTGRKSQPPCPDTELHRFGH